MAVRLLLCMAVWCGFGHASHALMSTVVRSSAPSLSSQDLQQNAEMHMAELKASAELGYQRISKVPDPPKSLSGIRPFYVPPHATGIGPACPFATSLPANSEGNLPLVFETIGPLFSSEECQAMIDEARGYAAAGRSGSTFTMDDTSRSFAAAQLPDTLAFLNDEGFPRVAALAGACFGESVVGDPKDLVLYRALVVQYDAAAGLTHQPVHRDHSLVTCVVTLNERTEYSGGGTYIEALDDAFAPPRGHALLQASALRHSGHTIESGERWVLVLFLMSARELRDGEHVRYLKARAQNLLEEAAEGDDAYDELQRCSTLARAMCGESDHELLCNQAVAELRRDNSRGALQLYDQALSVCGGQDRRLAEMLARVKSKAAAAAATRAAGVKRR